LAVDLTWLEGFARERPELHDSVVPLRLSAALLRNQVGPHLQHRPSSPLHIAIVGGAGTGKSTLANFLIGRAVAETNAQAGYTRHPVAYVSADLPAAQQLRPGILGPLQPVPGPVASNLDEDVFQVRPVEGMETPLQSAVIWDCPDMTTWKALDYQTRLVETIGLADLIIYVASDERYNDAWPTQYLRYILQSGKPVVACLTKMQPSQVAALVEHFRTQVIAKIPECAGVSATVALPQISTIEQADPAGSAARAPLTESIAWWLQNPDKTRQQGVQRAVRFLSQFQETLLLPARFDLQAAAQWESWVEHYKKTFIQRYQNEHLVGEQFPRFNAALVRLIEILELPGAGQIISKTMHLLRTPYRMIKGWFRQPDYQTLPEAEVLTSGFQGWLDYLRHATLQQNDQLPIWQSLRRAFHDKRDTDLMDALRQRCVEFSNKQALETETTARAIYEELEKSPSALNALRGFKFTVEAASLTGAIVTAGTHFLLYPLLLPVVASITQALAETLGKTYVDAQREKARQRQLDLFKETLAEPLAAELSRWPGELIPSLAELKVIVDRLPQKMSELKQAVEASAHLEVAA
jgi:hypothetical protein